MIEEIRISSLGVIEESVLELGSGFCAITGETGAGKTMLVTALGLLLGDRADSGVVRKGAAKARVEGVVRADERLAALVDDAGGEVEDGQVLLGRQISAEGRSRAFVGGAGAPASLLRDIADRLVAVHGQSDQHRLLKPEAQRLALDAFGGAEVSTLLTAYAEHYERLRAVQAELHEVTTSARERAREAEMLRMGLAEIEKVAPTPGEDRELAAEEARLGFADTLRLAAETARDALSADEGPDALGAISGARRALESVREHDAAAGALADRVGELGYLLTDLATEVASYAAGLETDPLRLAQVSDRRASLTDLTRKYAESIDEVLVWSEQSAKRLLELDGSDDRAKTLEFESEQLRATLHDVGGKLSTARGAAARRLQQEVTSELSQLAMPHAVLSIEVRPLERFGPTGLDEIELLLAANKGLEPRPLGKGASGGELSRVMLALEVVLAATSPVPTFVFDEVDAGVGGKAAVEIGRRLALLAQSAQVLVVTHLPQVAAFADQHVVVRKDGDGAVTTSGLESLDESGRAQELARMLAGLEDSETALAHAHELLETARESRHRSP